MTGDAAADAFKLICLGADGVILGRLLLQIMGCVGNEHGRCNALLTKSGMHGQSDYGVMGILPPMVCPPVLKTHITARFFVTRGHVKGRLFRKLTRKLMAPVGNSALPVGRADALVATDRAVAEALGIQYAC